MNQYNQPKIGAHEVMEFHEILCDTVDGINQFQLYQPFCQDPELQNILQNQLNFMTNEYNAMVQALQNKVNVPNLPVMNRNMNINVAPTYGMTPSSPEKPNTNMNQMNDRDVSSGMLGCAKSSATMRMHAALECTDSHLRNMMIQGAKNCADQAYEIWTYMNNKGYYQVPTFDLTTTQSLVNSYQPTDQMQGQGQSQNQMQNQFQNPNQQNNTLEQ